jgi:hypothetical protein
MRAPCVQNFTSHCFKADYAAHFHLLLDPAIALRETCRLASRLVRVGSELHLGFFDDVQCEFEVIKPIEK